MRRVKSAFARAAPSTAALAVAVAGTAFLAGTFAVKGYAHPPAKLTSEHEKGTIEEVKAFRKTLAYAIAARDAGALRGL